MHEDRKEHEKDDLLATVKRGEPLVSHQKYKGSDTARPKKSQDKTKVEHFNRNRNGADLLFDFREYGARDRLEKDGLEVSVGQTVTLIISESQGQTWKVEKEYTKDLWST